MDSVCNLCSSIIMLHICNTCGVIRCHRCNNLYPTFSNCFNNSSCDHCNITKIRCRMCSKIMDNISSMHFRVDRMYCEICIYRWNEQKIL